MGSDQELIDIIAGLSLFADLSHPQLEAAVHTFEEVMFNKGQRILRQGFSDPNFYVIVEGDAEVRINGKDRVKLSRGDFFGEISVLLGEPPSADIVAVSGLRCLTLPGQEVEEYLINFPHVMFRMLQAEARRLRQSNQWQN